MTTPEKIEIALEKQVADLLENQCISLNDALEELNLDPDLSQDVEFRCALDHHILCCVDCGYWYLPCIMKENAKGEEVCESCAELDGD